MEANVQHSIKRMRVHKSELSIITRAIHDDVSRMISSSSLRPCVYPHLGWNFSKDKWVLDLGAGVAENILATRGVTCC